MLDLADTQSRMVSFNFLVSPLGTWDACEVRKVRGMGARNGSLTRQLRIGIRHKGDRHVPTLSLGDDLEALFILPNWRHMDGLEFTSKDLF